VIALVDLLDAVASAGARLVGPAAATSFEGFAYDSRKLRPGEIFFAVRTARADGHDFIPDAIRHGASAIVGDRIPERSAWPGVTVVSVDDTLLALQAWARFALERYAPTVVAVLGPIGKTTAAKAIAAVLGHGFADDPGVFDGDNHNTLYGLSIALGRLTPTHRVAVLELAGGEPGELRALGNLTKPTIAVIVGAYGEPTLDAELSEIAAALPSLGRLILNADSPALADIAADWASRIAAPVRWYGTNPSADVRVLGIDRQLHHTGLTLVHSDHAAKVSLPLLGDPAVSAALGAAAVGLALGLSIAEIGQSLEPVRPIAGRLRGLPGQNGSYILDDSFDASPASLTAALDLFDRATGRKTVVLGELAVRDRTSANELHRQAGIAIGRRAQRLIAVGEGAEPAALAALGRADTLAKVITTDSVIDAATVVLDNVQSGDVTLVIGGAEARLERVVERILADPSTAPQTLVRQDAGWKQRVFLSRERPTWVEIDLAAIGGNASRLKQIASPAALMAVLKADAYGHGAIRVARTAVLNGADYLATACLSEAIALRQHGITTPILILGYTPPWQAEEILRYDLTATIFSLEPLRHLARAARAIGRGPARVHLKVDTGMGRLGVLPAEAPAFVEAARAMADVEVEGIYTHFASADAADPSSALEQIRRFNAVLEQVTRDGWRPRFVHAANSAGTLRFPQAHYSMVRSGIALYGLDPSPVVRCPEGFQPALTFKTLVGQVKELPSGSPISYGGTFVTDRRSRIAVLPVGYGDGFRRSPHNWGHVLVQGERAPIVGVVCMDMCMIDVTDITGVRAGDEVVLIGHQGQGAITAVDVASHLGTITYEVVTQILARVPREVPPGA
jgi:Alr-MurF fusion protein